MSTPNEIKTNDHKIFFIPGDNYSIQQECEYFSDEEIEKFMADSTPYGYVESYI